MRKVWSTLKTGGEFAVYIIIAIGMILGLLCALNGKANAGVSPLIAAHRGTWVGGYTPNSAKAFVNTHKYAKMLEGDVRETVDHRVIFDHDPLGTRTYGQLRTEGNASVLDLVVFLKRSTSNYVLIELKQTSYTSTFWTEFNKTLQPYKSRVIFYSLNSNIQVRDTGIKYGYQRMYHPNSGVATPTYKQIKAIGTYVWRSPCTYSATERQGIRFVTGLRNPKADFAKARKCSPFAIVTDYAKQAVQGDW